ncbi:MAG: VOC family protein, partial [Candidatus Eremiobacteraeota bacterium]|nr:VOC family protein [Candidatus Eremiobacteraeota bacterium]
TAQAVKVRGIDISTYLVQDVERAKAFYRDTMGFEMTMEYGENGGEFTFPDGTTFGLWKMEDGSWSKCDGVIFNVDDVQQAIEYYRSRGVKIADHTHDAPNCTMAFAEDSEGNNFILHQRKGGRS